MGLFKGLMTSRRSRRTLRNFNKVSAGEWITVSVSFGGRCVRKVCVQVHQLDAGRSRAGSKRCSGSSRDTRS